MAYLIEDWLDDPRLDLSDRQEIEVLCAALGCQPTDVYEAVSMVGDKFRDVRRYLESLLRRDGKSQ